MDQLLNQIHQISYDVLLPLIGNASVDVVVTDPPFGIGYQNNYTKSQHRMLEGDDDKFSYATLSKECFRVLKPDTAILCFTGWSEYPQHFIELKQSGFAMKEPIICQKRASGKTDLFGTFQSNADWCMFGHKGRFVFRKTEMMRNKRAGRVPNKGRKPVPEFKTRFPSCWFGEDFPWASENSAFQKQFGIYHPTIKGLEFIKWLILLSTNEGDTVLDPFMGSGTTAIAAKQLGRNFIGCEVDTEHHKTAIGRLLKYNNEDTQGIQNGDQTEKTSRGQTL